MVLAKVIAGKLRKIHSLINAEDGLKLARYKIGLQDILFVLSCVQLHIFRTIHTYIKLNTCI